MAQQQNKATAPVTKGQAAGKATGAAPIKISISPTKFVPVQKTAIPFRAFTLTELKDKNGQPATAATTFTLPNGKPATATQYLEQMNAFEQKLNALGYTLRSTNKTFKVGELSANKTLFTQQAASAKSLPAVTAKAKSTTMASVEQQFNTELSAAKAKPATTTQAQEGAKGAKGAKGTTAEGATTQQGAKGAKGGEGATAESGAGQKSAKIVKIPPGAVGVGAIGRALGPYTTTKSYSSPTFGDTSYVAADFTASMTFSGDANSASLSGVSKVTGWALGSSKDLAVATASLAAPHSGNLSANLKVTVLGTDEVVFNQSQQVSIRENSTYTKSLPDTWKFSMTIPVFIFSVDVTLGVKGGISMPYFLADLPGTTQGYIIPDVTGTVYGEAAVGIGGDDGVECGVKGEFTMIHNNLILYGNTNQGTDSTGTFVSYSVTSEDRLTALSGDIYAFASAFGGEVDEDIFNFTGIVAVYTPVEGNDKVYLKPISTVEANPGR
ncbi:MAG TPA: hypothetical protein VMJ32_13190 [Pirellulales bacterium]|nr:hypothetical protein [Pirellulales bacterium]